MKGRCIDLSTGAARALVMAGPSNGHPPLSFDFDEFQPIEIVCFKETISRISVAGIKDTPCLDRSRLLSR